MSTINQIQELYLQHGSRNPYPAQDEDTAALREREPFAGPNAKGGFLLSGCISYERGEALFIYAFRLMDQVFLRLATVAEFRQE